ncbi:MAG: TIGR02281 family clan AA aspartic protease [Paracoccaceae bacterium]
MGAFLLRDNFFKLFVVPDGVWWVALLAIGLVATAFATPARNLMGYFSAERHRALFALLALFCIGGIEYVNVERKAQIEQIGVEVAAVAVTGTETLINRSWDGHFRVIAQINGQDVGLMVDTGASLVLLRFDDATRIGNDMQRLDFSVPLTTANGKSYVAPMVIEQLSLEIFR